MQLCFRHLTVSIYVHLFPLLFRDCAVIVLIHRRLFFGDFAIVVEVQIVATSVVSVLICFVGCCIFLRLLLFAKASFVRQLLLGLGLSVVSEKASERADSTHIRGTADAISTCSRHDPWALGQALSASYLAAACASGSSLFSIAACFSSTLFCIASSTLKSA